MPTIDFPCTNVRPQPGALTYEWDTNPNWAPQPQEGDWLHYGWGYICGPDCLTTYDTTPLEDANGHIQHRSHLTMYAEFNPLRANPPMRGDWYWDYDQSLLVTFDGIYIPGVVTNIEMVTNSETGGFNPGWWLQFNRPDPNQFGGYGYTMNDHDDGWQERVGPTTLTVDDLESGSFTANLFFVITGGIYWSFLDYLALRITYEDPVAGRLKVKVQDTEQAPSGEGVIRPLAVDASNRGLIQGGTIIYGPPPYHVWSDDLQSTYASLGHGLAEDGNETTAFSFFPQVDAAALEGTESMTLWLKYRTPIADPGTSQVNIFFNADNPLPSTAEPGGIASDTVAFGLVVENSGTVADAHYEFTTAHMNAAIDRLVAGTANIVFWRYAGDPRGFKIYEVWIVCSNGPGGETMAWKFANPQPGENAGYGRLKLLDESGEWVRTSDIGLKIWRDDEGGEGWGDASV